MEVDVKVEVEKQLCYLWTISFNLPPSNLFSDK